MARRKQPKHKILSGLGKELALIGAHGLKEVGIDIHYRPKHERQKPAWKKRWLEK